MVVAYGEAHPVKIHLGEPEARFRASIAPVVAVPKRARRNRSPTGAFNVVSLNKHISGHDPGGIEEPSVAEVERHVNTDRLILAERDGRRVNHLCRNVGERPALTMEKRVDRLVGQSGRNECGKVELFVRHHRPQPYGALASKARIADAGALNSVMAERWTIAIASAIARAALNSMIGAAFLPLFAAY